MFYIVFDKLQNDVLYTKNELEAIKLCKENPGYTYDPYRAEPLPGESLEEAYKRRSLETKAEVDAMIKPTANLIKQMFEQMGYRV